MNKNPTSPNIYSIIGDALINKCPNHLFNPYQNGELRRCNVCNNIIMCNTTLISYNFNYLPLYQHQLFMKKYD